MSPLLNSKEAAEYLSISSRSLANARSSCVGIVIPYVKIGGSVKYKQSDLVNYVDRNTYRHTGELKLDKEKLHLKQNHISKSIQGAL